MARTPVPYYAIYGRSLVVHIVSPRDPYKWPPFLKIIVTYTRKFENSRGETKKSGFFVSFPEKFEERERRDKEKRILRFLSRKKKKKSGGKKGEKKVSGGEKNAAALLSILSIPSSYGDAYITLCGPARGLRSGRAG